MKKLSVLLMMLLLLTTGVSAGTNSILVTTSSSLSIELLNYQPVPAQPGDVVEVWIQVSNDGGEATKTGTLTVLDSHPFIVKTQSERVKEFNTIPAQESFLVKTRVAVDKNANEGTAYLTVQVQERGSDLLIEEDLPITIQGRSGALSITKTESTPAQLAPGEEGSLALTVRNIGETKLRNVQVSLDLDELSLAPTSSSNAKTISSLAGGQTATFTFDLVAFPGAEANAYQVPVTLAYEDEQGNSESQEETIGLVIGSPPELLVYLERNDLTRETMKGDIVVKFVNKGLSEIKLLEMEVLENDEVEVNSESPILYVGNIDEDDYESADVTLTLFQESVDVPIKVSYRDVLNRQYEETYTIHVDAKKGSGKNASNAWLWIILVIVLLAAFFWWRRSKKKKQR